LVLDNQTSVACEQSSEVNLPSFKEPIMNLENTTVVDHSLEDKDADTLQSSKQLVPDNQTFAAHEQSLEVNLQSFKELILYTENTIVMDHSLEEKDTDTLQSSKQIIPDNQTSVAHEQSSEVNLQSSKELIMNLENTTVLDHSLEE
jgi:predicted thioesterase